MSWSLPLSCCGLGPCVYLYFFFVCVLVRLGVVVGLCRGLGICLGVGVGLGMGLCLRLGLGLRLVLSFGLRLCQVAEYLPPSPVIYAHNRLVRTIRFVLVTICVWVLFFVP